MRAGKLKHLITIQQNTPTVSADGGLVDAWTTFAADIWAEVQTSGGREFWRQRQLNSELTHAVTIRHLADVKPAMRLSWGSRTLQIISVVDDENKQKSTVLNCREINA